MYLWIGNIKHMHVSSRYSYLCFVKKGGDSTDYNYCKWLSLKLYSLLKKKFISGSENNMEIDQNLFLYENA